MAAAQLMDLLFVLPLLLGPFFGTKAATVSTPPISPSSSQNESSTVPGIPDSHHSGNFSESNTTSNAPTHRIPTDWLHNPMRIPMASPQQRDVVPIWNAEQGRFDWLPLPNPAVDSYPQARSEQPCPPCPCLAPLRARRSLNDDYWYSTGPDNAVLSQIDLGYRAQRQMKQTLGQIPLHFGTIYTGSPIGAPGDRAFGLDADFNFPEDANAFGRRVYGERFSLAKWSADQFSIWSKNLYRLLEPVEALNLNTNAAVILAHGVFRFESIYGRSDVLVRDLKSNSAYVVRDCLDLVARRCERFQAIYPWVNSSNGPYSHIRPSAYLLRNQMFGNGPFSGAPSSGPGQGSSFNEANAV